MKLPKLRNGIDLLLVMIVLGLTNASSVTLLVPVFAALWGGTTICRTNPPAGTGADLVAMAVFDRTMPGCTAGGSGQTARTPRWRHLS